MAWLPVPKPVRFDDTPPYGGRWLPEVRPHLPPVGEDGTSWLPVPAPVDFGTQANTLELVGSLVEGAANRLGVPARGAPAGAAAKHAIAGQVRHDRNDEVVLDIDPKDGHLLVDFSGRAHATGAARRGPAGQRANVPTMSPTRGGRGGNGDHLVESVPTPKYVSLSDGGAVWNSESRSIVPFWRWIGETGPWRFIGTVLKRDETGTTWTPLATGTLVGSHHVLTAAHPLVGKAASSLAFMPAPYVAFYDLAANSFAGVPQGYLVGGAQLKPIQGHEVLRPSRYKTQDQIRRNNWFGKLWASDVLWSTAWDHAVLVLSRAPDVTEMIQSAYVLTQTSKKQASPAMYWMQDATDYGHMDVATMHPSWKGMAVFTQVGQVEVPSSLPISDKLEYTNLGKTFYEPPYHPPSVLLYEDDIGVFGIESFSEGGGACALKYHADWTFGMSGGPVFSQSQYTGGALETIVGVLASGNNRFFDHTMASGGAAMVSLVEEARTLFP